MSRMSMWKDGHRRSPRISALDASKAHIEKGGSINASRNSTQVMPMEHKGLGPHPRTRARKKRKLRPVQDVAVSSVTTTANPGTKRSVDKDDSTNGNRLSVFNARNSPKYEDVQSSVVSSAEWLPEKHILELILDTLQRRDSHEIFAEPVDPEEVEDYYEIIKEPMDFGTMRAKLHEGMYNNLEQFEHDVFLIYSNAMHFNSSATNYFRQARALQELSKKVFHVLKTDPRNFEMEFTATGRRPGRKLQDDAKGSNFSSPPKHTAIVRSRSMTNDGSSKSSRSISGPSSLRRTVWVDPECSGTITHFETGNPEAYFGAGHGRRSTFSETEQRHTCQPWMSFLDENESIISTIYNNHKPLLHVNQHDIGYIERLMMFVKDVGPVAQMVAEKKLQRWWPGEPGCLTPSSDLRFLPSICENPSTDILDIQNATRSGNPLYHLFNISSGGMDLTVSDKMIKTDTIIAMANSSDGGEEASNSSKRVNFPAVLGGEMVHQNHSAGVHLASYSCTQASDLDPTLDAGNDLRPVSVDSGKLDNQVQRPALSSESSQSNLHEKFTSRTVNNLASSSLPLQTEETPMSSQGTGLWLLANSGLQYLSVEDPATAATTPKFAGVNQPRPLVSQFIFDLPFVRSRLSQMNSSGQMGMQRGSVDEGPIPNKRGHEGVSIHAHRA